MGKKHWASDSQQPPIHVVFLLFMPHSNIDVLRILLPNTDMGNSNVQKTEPFDLRLGLKNAS
jgi:hypothetical protein